MSKTWRQSSAEIIHERFTSIRAAQPPTVTDEEILRMVSLHYYPFGERKYYVYKAWLLAMKDYRQALRLGPTYKERQKETPLFPQ